MNEFTKEELQDLHDSLYGGMHDDFPIPEENKDLQQKIKSMIDNYPKEIDGFIREPQNYTSCNHDWHELEMAEPATPTIICIKCRAIHFIRIEHE